MASWKRYEREIAKALGGERIPILGREGADIDVNNLWIDCKKRQQVPKQWDKLLTLAEGLGWHGFMTFSLHTASFINAMRLDQFALFREIPMIVEARVPVSDLPIKWLCHIRESSPDDHMPIVIMNKTGRPYRESIVVFEFGHYIRWYSDTHKPDTARTSAPASSG